MAWQQAKRERNLEIVRRLNAGETIALLARDYGLSPLRIRQIRDYAESDAIDQVIRDLFPPGWEPRSFPVAWHRGAPRRER